MRYASSLPAFGMPICPVPIHRFILSPSLREGWGGCPGWVSEVGVWV